MSQTKLSWSVPVALADIPDTGQRFDLVADEETRVQVANLAGLRALPRLEATFDVTRHGARGLRVKGHVAATVGQTCVVTLDPVENEIEESVDLVFTPPGIQSGMADSGDAMPVNLEPETVEPLIDDSVDLGALATEFLLLAIDPYPRKRGAKFEPPPVDDAKASPFAALAALKKGRNAKND
ncbi:MAG: DUF177 domain-containing protein [Xanthobacteraceae bacterium]